MCYDLPWVEITELYVAPTHRRRGAATALLREAEVRAADTGASELLARTNTKNGPAQTLLRRIGLDAAPHVVFRRTYVAAV